MLDCLVPVTCLEPREVIDFPVRAELKALVGACDIERAPCELLRDIRRLLSQALLVVIAPGKFQRLLPLHYFERVRRRRSEGDKAIRAKLDECPLVAQLKRRT